MQKFFNSLAILGFVTLSSVSTLAEMPILTGPLICKYTVHGTRYGNRILSYRGTHQDPRGFDSNGKRIYLTYKLFDLRSIDGKLSRRMSDEYVVPMKDPSPYESAKPMFNFIMAVSKSNPKAAGGSALDACKKTINDGNPYYFYFRSENGSFSDYGCLSCKAYVEPEP